MKKRFYPVGLLCYNRDKKCGIETIALIGVAVASTAVGVAEASANRGAAEQANALNAELTQQSLEQQKELFHEGNIFNAEQAKITREYNSKEAEINREWEEQMTDKQMQKAMDWFDKYSSPASQYKQYLDAGLNPATLAGNTNGFTPSFSLPSASAASSSPASSGSIPSASVFPQQPVTSNFSGAIQDALGNMSSIFSMSKTQAETEGIVTDNQFKSALNDANLELTRETSRKVRSDINYNIAKTDETNKNIEKIGEEIKAINSSIANVDADTAIKNLDYWFKGEEYTRLLNKLEQDMKISREIADAQIKLYTSEVLKNRADASAAYATASYYKALENIKIPAEKKQFESYANLLQAKGNREWTQNYLDTFFAYDERKQNFDIGVERYARAKYENSTLFKLINGGASVTNSVGNAVFTYLLLK